MSKVPSLLEFQAQRLSAKVQELALSSKGKLAAVGTSAVVLASNASAAVTMPAADYGDIELAAAVGFGVTLFVGLLMKAKRFFR